MKKILLIISFALCAVSLHAQETALPRFITDSLDAYIRQGMQDWQIPAVAVAIVKDGKIIVSKGYGNTKIGGKEAVDENTLFMIGSNSKLFTATTLALLQERGTLKLEDKVQKWLPYFKLKNEWAGKETNITDLLSHQLGFETFQGDFTYWGSKLTREEVIKKMALIDAPYDFRAKWGYCNAGYVVAGEIIRSATGKSWEETVRDSILKPLQMNRTLMLGSEFKKAQNIAFPYSLIDGKLQEIPIIDIMNLAPAGSICSSVKDMSNWLLAHLNEGKLNGKQILPAQAILAPRTPYAILDIDTRSKRHTHFSLYGLGLGINDRKERLVYSHTGGVDGFLSNVLFIPEENLGIIFLTNSDSQAFFASATQDIQDAFLGLPTQTNAKMWAQNKKAKTMEKQESDQLTERAKNAPSPSLPLSAYTGKYQNPLYGEVEIKAEKQGLVIYFPLQEKLTGKLAHMGNNEFLCKFSWNVMGASPVPFEVENGKVKGFTLKVADMIELTPYKFTKKE